MSTDEAAFAVTLNQVLSVWVTPEIIRRQKAGKIARPFNLRAAQVIMNVGEGAPVVRLNDEIRAMLRARVRRPVQKGQLAYWDDLSEIDRIDLTAHDPNAGGITILRHEGKWLLHFDFRYNAQRIAEGISAAQEFLDAAKASLAAGTLRPFVDTLFSATELMARGRLLMHPDEKLLTSKKHTHIASWFNRWGHLGNVKQEHVALLNRLADLRRPARYMNGHLSLTVDQAQEMLSTAETMMMELRRDAPTRAPISLPTLSPSQTRKLARRGHRRAAR